MTQPDLQTADDAGASPKGLAADIARVIGTLRAQSAEVSRPPSLSTPRRSSRSPRR
ncbi:hypothetical protein SANTM175S_03494 [Streptomyces antimycoticus]